MIIGVVRESILEKTGTYLVDEDDGELVPVTESLEQVGEGIYTVSSTGYSSEKFYDYDNDDDLVQMTEKLRTEDKNKPKEKKRVDIELVFSSNSRDLEDIVVERLKDEYGERFGELKVDTKDIFLAE